MHFDSNITSDGNTNNKLWREYRWSIIVSGIFFFIGFVPIAIQYDATLGITYFQINNLALVICFLLLITLIGFFIPILIEVRVNQKLISPNFNKEKEEGLMHQVKQIADDLTQVITDLGDHEKTLKKHNTDLVHGLKSVDFLLKPEILSKLFPSSNSEFDYLLQKSISINQAKISSLVNGTFFLSTDTFVNYYFNRLLKKDDVKYYFSSAIIDSKDYFIVNNIEELARKYYYLAQNKDVILLWFVKKLSFQELLHLARRKQGIEKKAPQIQIVISKYRILFDSGLEELARDFGIAGDVAGAEIVNGTEVEINYKNKRNIKVRMDDKYKIDFSNEFRNELLGIFKKQVKYLQDEGKLVTLPDYIN